MSAPTVTPFLTFSGQAAEAIRFYVELIDGSEIVSMTHVDGAVSEPVQFAEFRLGSQRVLAIDSPVQHAWTFTPALSLFVEDPNEAAISRYFKALSDGGKVLMPLDAYPFSKHFAWVEDRFGVSWQLTAGTGT